MIMLKGALQVFYILFITSIHSVFVDHVEPEYQIYNRSFDIARLFKNFVRTLTDQDLNITAENSIQIWCSRSDKPNVTRVFLDDQYIEQKLNTELPIAFIFHGLNDHGQRQWIKDMIRDYIRFVQTNVCSVNWSPLSMNFYTVSARQTDHVATAVAKFIRNLVPIGFSFDKITLIGHSMGAHIAGMIGHNLKGRVGKIIGLDPAGPYFTTLVPRPVQRRLDKSSAKFVQAIHTDKYIIGTEVNLGHQDFYPAGGATPQPGCLIPILQKGAMGYTKIVCSHFKAVEYFRYSLNPANKFKGSVCSNYGSFSRGSCRNNKQALIGLHDSFTENGTFYLDVSSYPPFALS